MIEKLLTRYMAFGVVYGSMRKLAVIDKIHVRRSDDARARRPLLFTEKAVVVLSGGVFGSMWSPMLVANDISVVECRLRGLDPVACGLGAPETVTYLDALHAGFFA